MPPVDSRPGYAGPGRCGTQRLAGYAGPGRFETQPTRATPRIMLYVAGGLLLARIGLGVWLREKPVARDLVNWQPVAGAETAARRAGQPVLYDFTAEWCPPCRTLGTEVFDDKKAAEMINAGFHPVRVVDQTRESGRNTAEVAALQRKYKVNGFPTLVIVPLERGSPPVIIRGYPGRRAVLKALEAAAGRATRP